MFEFTAEATPLPRRVLERDADRRILRGAKRLIQAGDDLFQTRRLALSEVRARVHYEKGQSELRPKSDFLHERFQRLVAVVAGRRAEVDEVSGMAEDRRYFLGGHFVRVKCKRLRLRRLAEPLHVVLHKNLDNIAADGDPALQGLPDPTARRHMCAKFHRTTVAS